MACGKNPGEAPVLPSLGLSFTFTRQFLSGIHSREFCMHEVTSANVSLSPVLATWIIIMWEGHPG